MHGILDQYLLLVEFSNLGAAPSSTEGQSYYASTAGNIHQALLPMFAIPPQQLHPDAARHYNEPHWVRNLTLLDLTTGKPVASTLYYEPADRKTAEATYFVLEAGGSLQMLQLSPQLFQPTTSSGEPTVGEMVQWDSVKSQLGTTPLYQELFDQCLKYGVAAHTDFLPGTYTLRTQAADLPPAGTAQARTIAQYTTIEHVFSTLNQAVDQLIRTDPNMFLLTSALENKLPYYIERSAIFHASQPQTPLASCEVFLSGMGVPPIVYLSFDGPVRQSLKELGFGPLLESVRANENGLTLARLQDGTTMARPLEVARLINRLEEVSQRSPLECRYRSDTTVYVPAEEPTSAILAAYSREHRYYHTNHLTHALLDMLLQYVPNLLPQKGPRKLREIPLPAIRSAAGKLMANIGTGLDGSDRVVLLLSSAVMADPTLQQLGIERLAAGCLREPQTDAVYIPVATLSSAKLLPTEPYRQFFTNLLANTIVEQITTRPELQKRFVPPSIATHRRFEVDYHWILDTPLPVKGTGAPMASTEVTSLLQGMNTIKDIDATLFFRGELHNQDIPLRLDKVSLWETQDGQGHLLLQRSASQQPDKGTQYQLIDATNEIVTAFKIAIGEAHLEGALHWSAHRTPRKLGGDNHPPGIKP